MKRLTGGGLKQWRKKQNRKLGCIEIKRDHYALKPSKN